MFLVGICDIFLILYLTTLSQVSLHQNSDLTVADYNKLKASEGLAIGDIERLKEMNRKLENVNYALGKEKYYALQSVQSVENKNKIALDRIETFEAVIKKSKEAEAKALEVVNREKEKILHVENELSEALRDEEEAGKLLQSTLEEKKLALQRFENAYLKEQIAVEKEQEALLAAKEAQKEAEKAKENEAKALEIAKEAQKEAEKAKDNEDKAIKLAKESQKQKEFALQNERLARDAENEALEVASAAKNETAETKLKIRTINAACRQCV